MMVGVSASFVPIDINSQFCAHMDGDDTPDIASSYGTRIDLSLSDPPS